MILKLESSISSPVAISLEVSMPHQPFTFSFLKCQFSKYKLVVHSFQADLFRSWSCIATLSLMRSQILIVPFALYVCAMEKILSKNAFLKRIRNCIWLDQFLVARAISVIMGHCEMIVGI